MLVGPMFLKVNVSEFQEREAGDILLQVPSWLGESKLL